MCDREWAIEEFKFTKRGNAWYNLQRYLENSVIQEILHNFKMIWLTLTDVILISNCANPTLPMILLIYMYTGKG